MKGTYELSALVRRFLLLSLLLLLLLLLGRRRFAVRAQLHLVFACDAPLSPDGFLALFSKEIRGRLAVLRIDGVEKKVVDNLEVAVEL